MPVTPPNQRSSLALRPSALPRLLLLAVALTVLAATFALSDVAHAAAQLSFKETPTGWSVTSGEANDNVGEVQAKGLKKKNRIRYSLAGPSSFSIKPRTGIVQYDGSAISSDVTETHLAVTATDRRGKASEATVTITVSVTQPAAEPELQKGDPEPESEPQVGNIPAQDALRIRGGPTQSPLIYEGHSTKIAKLSINRFKTIQHERYDDESGRTVFIPEKVARRTKGDGVTWHMVDFSGNAKSQGASHHGFSVSGDGTVTFDYWESDWKKCTPHATNRLKSHTPLREGRDKIPLSRTDIQHQTTCPDDGNYRDSVFPNGYSYYLTVEARHGGQTARLDIKVSAIQDGPNQNSPKRTDQWRNN